MKKILSLVLASMMVMGTTMAVSAEDTDNKEAIAVATLINEKAKNFTIEQNGDEFTIIVSENSSTGYMWTYTPSDVNLVEFIGEETIVPDVMLMGSPYELRLTFKALAEGISTIKFENTRAFEYNEGDEHFDLLVYKTGDQVIVEEDQEVHVFDNVKPTLYTLSETATYKGVEITSDIAIQNIEGITMIPLRATLEAMGYTISWNQETQSIEILKGPKWTSVSIGKNAYFKNKMAAHELSSAPVLVNNRTLIPIEFIADIIGSGIEVENQKINFTDSEAVIHSGYVKTMTTDETGTKTLTLTSDLTSDSIELQTIIHTSPAYTFYNTEVSEGSYVQVVGAMFMTMSIPGQTSGYVVY